MKNKKKTMISIPKNLHGQEYSRYIIENKHLGILKYFWRYINVIILKIISTVIIFVCHLVAQDMFFIC